MRIAASLIVLACASAQASPVVLKGRPRIPGAAPFVEPHHAATFLYAGYYQAAGGTTSGAGAKMKQGDPGLAAGDAHTLGEIAVMSGDSRQIVEIGWTVDPGVNGDVQPRLFVFHWIDGMPTCYNACGFVQVSTTKRPGMKVVPGAVADYGIELRGTDWYLRYQNEDVGYFPGSLWPAPFTQAGHVQWFGEIAAGLADSCSEMGNGAKGNESTAAAMSELYLVASGGSHVPAVAATGEVTNAAFWNVGNTTPTSFSFGGPGSPFGCCTPKTCADSMAACGAVPDGCGPAIACGGCEGGDICDEVFTCSPPPEPGEQPTIDDDAGCCSTGSPLRALPGLAAIALLLRRRRRR